MKKLYYSNLNDEYFRMHLGRFVKFHAGEWVVIAGGQLIGFTCKENLSKLVKKARKQFPDDTPIVSPIPRKEELDHILCISKLQNKKKPDFEKVFAKVKRLSKDNVLNLRLLRKPYSGQENRSIKNHARKRKR